MTISWEPTPHNFFRSMWFCPWETPKESQIDYNKDLNGCRNDKKGLRLLPCILPDPEPSPNSKINTKTEKLWIKKINAI